MSTLFSDRNPISNRVDDTGHRLRYASNYADQNHTEHIFAELLRAQRMDHIEALQMPDGLGKKPIDYASSILCHWCNILGYFTKDTSHFCEVS